MLTQKVKALLQIQLEFMREMPIVDGYSRLLYFDDGSTINLENKRDIMYIDGKRIAPLNTCLWGIAQQMYEACKGCYDENEWEYFVDIEQIAINEWLLALPEIVQNTSN